MRHALIAVVAFPFLLAACETGPSGSQSGNQPTTTAAAPVQTAQSGGGCLTRLYTNQGAVAPQLPADYDAGSIVIRRER